LFVAGIALLMGGAGIDVNYYSVVIVIEPNVDGD
jgi:hypothetical protein